MRAKSLEFEFGQTSVVEEDDDDVGDDNVVLVAFRRYMLFGLFRFFCSWIAEGNSQPVPQTNVLERREKKFPKKHPFIRNIHHHSKHELY